MRRLRFTIANLLGVVLFVAIAFAALREATDLWESGLFTLTLGLLATAVLLAIHRTRERRAYWLGFALFGAVYLVASLVPLIESRLLTTKGLAYLAAQIPRRDRFLSFIWDVSTSSNPSGPGGPNGSLPTVGYAATSPPQGAVQVWQASSGIFLARPFGASENFLQIGHSLFTLLAALVGGFLSRRLAARSPGPAGERTDSRHDEAAAIGDPLA